MGCKSDEGCKNILKLSSLLETTRGAHESGTQKAKAGVKRQEILRCVCCKLHFFLLVAFLLTHDYNVFGSNRPGLGLGPYIVPSKFDKNCMSR